MRGNLHVRFLGEAVAARRPPYPTVNVGSIPITCSTPIPLDCFGGSRRRFHSTRAAGPSLQSVRGIAVKAALGGASSSTIAKHPLEY